jgi:3-oxoacyl-[acyl-carrier-protein] synthase-3
VDGPRPADHYPSNPRYRNPVVGFGEGAGAMVFRAHQQDDGRGILGARLYGEGGEKEILYVPGVGSKRRPYVSAATLEEAASVPVMDGRAVFKHAVSRMPEVTRQVLGDQGYGLPDLDLLVMHQANLRINEAARKALDLPEQRVHNNIQKYGNTTSATLPLAFHEARAEGKAPAGSLVAFTALGAGLHWGSVLMRV